MKPFFISVFLAAALQAQTYREIIDAVSDSLALKSAEQLEAAARKNYDSVWDTQLPTLDASLSAVHLVDRPTITFYLPGVPPQHAPMGTNDKFVGELALRYPLFTGFAQSAQVEQARLRAEKAALQVQDLRRNLYLKAGELYGTVRALDNAVAAQADAKAALKTSYDKAKGMHEAGLLGDAELYNIEAAFYEIDAKITELKARRREALDMLGYLVHAPVDDCAPIAGDGPVLDKASLLEQAHSREDIRALARALDIANTQVTLAKSRYYPSVGVSAALKHQGKDLQLNGDGYLNANQSYIGAEARWNLFSGMSDRRRVEAAQLQALAARTQLADYTDRVMTELRSAFSNLDALLAKRKSARARLEAQRKYYELTRGRFEHQLADADALSRATANLAAAKAQLSTLDARIFVLKTKILLQSGLDAFRAAMRP